MMSFTPDDGYVDRIGRRVLALCEELAQISSEEGRITRLYLTDEHRAANDLVGDWMVKAGLECHQDAAGNLCGRKPSNHSGAATLLFGSHLDTVPNGGRYDGALGVIAPLLAMQLIKECDVPDHVDATRLADLPFTIGIVGFGDEEGSRFGTTLMGSCATAGHWQEHWFELVDHAGCSLREAFTNFGLEPAKIDTAAIAADSLLGYFEVHIEQGPVLEDRGLPLGVVSGIAGARRFRILFKGKAGHAGTVPMDLRQDALLGASDFISRVHEHARAAGVTATVGSINCSPNAANVIAGQVEIILDVRSEVDQRRDELVAALKTVATKIQEQRQLEAVDWSLIHDAPAAPCSEVWRRRCADAITGTGLTAYELPSGAGHDAMAMAQTTDIGMLFVRCAQGISHHPDESITAADAGLAVCALFSLLEQLALDQDGQR